MRTGDARLLKTSKRVLFNEKKKKHSGLLNWCRIFSLFLFSSCNEEESAVLSSPVDR